MTGKGQGLPSLLTTASGVCGSEPPARWSPAERPVLAAKRPFLLGRIGEEDRTEPPDAATANGRFCFGCQPTVTYPPVVMRRVREPPERESAGGWVGCLVRLLSYRAFCRVALPYPSEGRRREHQFHRRDGSYGMQDPVRFNSV